MSTNHPPRLYWLKLYELSSTRVLLGLFHINFTWSLLEGIHLVSFWLKSSIFSYPHCIALHHTSPRAHLEMRFDMFIILDGDRMVLEGFHEINLIQWYDSCIRHGNQGALLAPLF